MNIISQTPRIYSTLYYKLNEAIYQSVLKTHNRCSKKAQEPDYVAGLVLDFTPELFSILNSLYKGIEFSVSGIFCHQKPLAHIPNSKPDPEIGDILFVLIDTDHAGFKRLNSILFQAKMSKEYSFNLTNADEHQLKLYTKWPDFSYKRAGKLTGQRRRISPKTVSTGAQFMLIDDSIESSLAGKPGTFSIGCATPNKYVTINNNLAIELIDFITHRSGRPFGDINEQHDSWSRMIWDLISIAKDKASKRINSGLTSFPRTVTKYFDGLYFLIGDTRTILSDLNKDIFYELNQQTISPNDNGAVSVILIESFNAQ